MNKSLKVVSSVAIAGMLAINVLNPITLAKSVDDRYDTKLAGTYKGMAQFVLANKNDYVTYREIANSGKFTNVESFKGTGVPSNDNELAQTGDKFVADGKEYTIVVYGEVDKSSNRLTQDDALKILKHFTGSSKMINAAELEAANVDRTNDRITQDDALQVLKYFTGSTSTLIKGDLPHDEYEEPVEEDENFTISFNSEYVNNINENAQVKATVSVKNLLKDASTALSVKVEDSNKNHTPIITSGSITNTEIKTEITLGNLSTLDDGTLKVSLLDSIGKILRTTTIVKNTEAVEFTNVRTNRINSTEATFALNGYGKNEITKVYYIADTTSTNPASIDLETAEEIIAVSNGIQTNIKSIENEHTVYYVHYIVENKYGSQSSVKTAIVAKEEATKNASVKVAKPDLENTATAIFTLTNADDTAFTGTATAIVYKDNKIIGEVDNTANAGKIDITSLVKTNGVGEYKVSVVATGDGENTSDSDATSSETIRVSQLQAITGVSIKEDENNAGDLIVSWNKSNEDIKGYSIKLYSIKTDGTIDDSLAAIDINDKDTITKTISGQTKDRVYYADVKAVSKTTQLALIDSENTKSNQTYLLDTTNALGILLSNITANSATVTVSNLKTITGLNSSCTLKIFEVTGETGDEAAKYNWIKDIKNVEFDKNNEIVVDGLLANKAYAFRLIEKIGETEIPTTYVTTATMKQEPSVQNLTVSDYNSAKVVGSNKIATDTIGGVIKTAINGVEYIDADNAKVASIRAIVATLKEGDILTINEENVILNLANNIQIRTFAGTLAGKNVTINCNTKVAKTLITTSAVEQLTLNGTGAIYDISGITANSNIVVNSGVSSITDTNEKDIKVNANTNSPVKINGVSVETKGTIVSIANADKDVTVKVNESTSDTLKLTNNADITFVTSKTNNKTILSGNITIDTPEAVTITSNGVAVDANIKVISAAKVTNEIAKTIDLTNITGLNGTKSVIVSKGAKTTVKFYSLTNAPEDNGIQKTTTSAVSLKQNYIDNVGEANDDIAELVTAGLITNRTDVEEVKVVTDYLKSFGINDTNAKLTLKANNEITITFTNGATQTVEINNIK